MKFTKYHGLGNDFIIINYDDLPQDISLKELAIKICNRNTGVGSDGLVIAGNPQEKYKMTFYDPSGYKDKMCGNAIRCLTMHYWREEMEKTQFKIHTDDGLKIIDIVSIFPFVVKVNMKTFSWNPQDIPMVTNLDKINREKFNLVDGKQITYSAVQFGPAHVVIESNATNDDYIHSVVNQMNKPDVFPEEACFNFALIKDRHNVDLRTWERGLGITLACGTGSCATAAILEHNKLIDFPVNINQALGKLTISKVGDDYMMEGPAEYVFEGKYRY